MSALVEMDVKHFAPNMIALITWMTALTRKGWSEIFISGIAPVSQLGNGTGIFLRIARRTFYEYS